MRTGVIAKKVGMTRVYTEDGTHIPVTVMQLDACQVVGQRTAEKTDTPQFNWAAAPKRRSGSIRPSADNSRKSILSRNLNSLSFAYLKRT